MPATKKAAKKAAPKVTKTQFKPQDVAYVVSVRNSMFGWTPQIVFTTYDQAAQQRELLEKDSILGISYAKVTRVVLGN